MRRRARSRRRRTARPVSDRPDEALTYFQTVCAGNIESGIGDLVRVPLACRTGDPFQPENWRLAPGPWQRLARPALPRASLVEAPPGLWLEPGQASDRVSEESLRRQPPSASLHVIRPEQARFQIRFDRRTGEPKLCCIFRYAGADYKLSVTDPVGTARYLPLLADARRADEFAPAAPAGLLLCVSLGLPFDGYRFKIAATLIEGRALDDAPDDARLFTVGHSNHELAHFLALLRRHGIEAVVDVRSVPVSGRNPHFNRDMLQPALRGAGVMYGFLGEELGARRTEREAYDEGKALYERIVDLPKFRTGIDRVLDGITKCRVALMCAEKDPLDCHRAILVCRELAKSVPGILHILADGKLETHAEAEERLMVLHGEGEADLFRPREERAALAYARRGERICYAESEDRDERDQALHHRLHEEGR
ncbi:MAG: DUF488 domain-containing protein [Gemmataceae bacterium]|nr:DUF488 domain-containing protein [Gemmataceae bacterium]